MVTTVLGTCVSVCLWDKRRSIGGMNHFLLPRWDGESLASLDFGDVAIPELLKTLERLQCRRTDVIAKVFGGKHIRKGFCGLTAIGEENGRVAIEMLDRVGIPVLAKDLGDRFGRKLLFNTATGEVLVKRFLTERFACAIP